MGINSFGTYESSETLGFGDITILDPYGQFPDSWTGTFNTNTNTGSLSDGGSTIATFSVNPETLTADITFDAEKVGFPWNINTYEIHLNTNPSAAGERNGQLYLKSKNITVSSGYNTESYIDIHTPDAGKHHHFISVIDLESGNRLGQMIELENEETGVISEVYDYIDLTAPQREVLKTPGGTMMVYTTDPSGSEHQLILTNSGGRLDVQVYEEQAQFGYSNNRISTGSLPAGRSMSTINGTFVSGEITPNDGSVISDMITGLIVLDDTGVQIPASAMNLYGAYAGSEGFYTGDGVITYPFDHAGRTYTIQVRSTTQANGQIALSIDVVSGVVDPIDDVDESIDTPPVQWQRYGFGELPSALSGSVALVFVKSDEIIVTDSNNEVVCSAGLFDGQTDTQVVIDNQSYLISIDYATSSVGFEHVEFNLSDIRINRSNDGRAVSSSLDNLIDGNYLTITYTSPDDPSLTATKTIELTDTEKTRLTMVDGSLQKDVYIEVPGLDGEEQQYTVTMANQSGTLVVGLDETDRTRDADGNEYVNGQLEGRPQGVEALNKHEKFTLDIGRDDVAVLGRMVSVNYPENISQLQRELVDGLTFTNDYKWTNVGSIRGWFDTPSKFALRDGGDIIGGRTSIIDFANLAEADKFEEVSDSEYESFYSHDNWSFRLSLHRVLTPGTGEEKWYTQIEVLEVPEVQERPPIDFIDEDKWGRRARRLGEGIQDAVVDVVEIAGELIGGIIPDQRPEGWTRGDIKNRFRERFPDMPLDPDETVGGMVPVPDANIEQIPTGFDYILPETAPGYNYVWSPFKQERPGGSIHDGIDIRVPAGTQIRAPSDGEIVRKVRNHPGNYGHLIVTKHEYTEEDGTEMDMYFYYAHLPQEQAQDPLFMNDMDVGNGDAPVTITRGQVIGLVGNSGNAEHTDSHLHLEALKFPKGTPYSEVARIHAEMASTQNRNDPRWDQVVIHPIRAFPDVNWTGNIPGYGLSAYEWGEVPSGTTEEQFIAYMNNKWGMNLSVLTLDSSINYGSSNEKKKEFIDLLVPNATELADTFKVPVSIILAQAIEESGRGSSNIARNGKNLFGIKPVSRWKGGVISGHRQYEFHSQSMLDHSLFLTRQNRLYLRLIGQTPDYWAQELDTIGYATDSQYEEKLKGHMQRYNLYQYDILLNGGGDHTHEEDNTNTLPPFTVDPGNSNVEDIDIPDDHTVTLNRENETGAQTESTVKIERTVGEIKQLELVTDTSELTFVDSGALPSREIPGGQGRHFYRKKESSVGAGDGKYMIRDGWGEQVLDLSQKFRVLQNTGWEFHPDKEAAVTTGTVTIEVPEHGEYSAKLGMRTGADGKIELYLLMKQ